MVAAHCYHKRRLKRPADWTTPANTTPGQDDLVQLGATGTPPIQTPGPHTGRQRLCMFYSNRHAASPHTIISHHATAVMHAMLSTMGDAPRTTQKARCWQRMPKALPPPPGARKPTVQLTLCNYNVRRQTPVTLFRHMSQVPSAKHNLSAHSVCHWHSWSTTRKPFHTGQRPQTPNRC